MVGALRRMNKATERVRDSYRYPLLAVRVGPGAAVLPSDITRIHMEFNHAMNGGHMGPRKFWKENLPRLKYWNPAIPMIVNRRKDTEGPATMTLYFRQKDSAQPTDANMNQQSSSVEGRSPAADPSEGERTVVINMKDMHSSMILKEFLEKTGAVPVPPTPQDEAELQEMKDLEQRATVDQARVKKRLDLLRSESAFLKAAGASSA